MFIVSIPNRTIWGHGLWMRTRPQAPIFDWGTKIDLCELQIPYCFSGVSSSAEYLLLESTYKLRGPCLRLKLATCLTQRIRAPALMRQT